MSAVWTSSAGKCSICGVPLVYAEDGLVPGAHLAKLKAKGSHMCANVGACKDRKSANLKLLASQPRAKRMRH